MPDEVVTQEGSTTEDASVQSQTTTPPAAAAKTEPDQKWIKERLDQKERSILKDLGVENLEEAKAALAQLKAKKDAEKSAEQKAADATAKLSQAEQKAKEAADALAEVASSQLASLSEEQRKAVAELAGDDPGKQLKAIKALSPTWSKKPADSAVTTRVADTAPSKKQPDSGITQPPNIRAEYEALQKSNPILASRFFLENRDAIVKTYDK